MDAKSQVRRFREPPYSYDFHRDEFLRQLISLHCPNLSFAQTYTKYAYAPGNRKLKRRHLARQKKLNLARTYFRANGSMRENL